MTNSTKIASFTQIIVVLAIVVDFCLSDFLPIKQIFWLRLYVFFSVDKKWIFKIITFQHEHQTYAYMQIEIGGWNYGYGDLIKNVWGQCIKCNIKYKRIVNVVIIGEIHIFIIVIYDTPAHLQNYKCLESVLVCRIPKQLNRY